MLQVFIIYEHEIDRKVLQGNESLGKYMHAGKLFSNIDIHCIKLK